MKREEILETAKKCVCGEREQDYGTPEENFSTIGQLWATYLRAAHPVECKDITIITITPKDVAIMMSLLKVARIATGKSPDSFVDLAGYAACAGEIATEKRESMERKSPMKLRNTQMQKMPKSCRKCDYAKSSSECFSDKLCYLCGRRKIHGYEHMEKRPNWCPLNL